LALLALIAGQDVDGSYGTDGRWRIARRVAEDRIHLHGRSGGQACAQNRSPVPGRLQRPRGHRAGHRPVHRRRVDEASGQINHEAVVGLSMLDNDVIEGGVFDVFGDSAYGTWDTRAALAQMGHLAIIKPGPARPTVEGGFTTDDFTIDEHAGTVTCPAGITRTLTPTRHAVFGAACHTCPLRPRCTDAKKGRTLRLHAHDALLRQARRDWATCPDLQDSYRLHRPMVERSIAWLIGPKGRCRKLRYRGVAANNLWLHTRMAALNLRHLITLDLNRHNTWALP
jgi:hypothetical protein